MVENKENFTMIVNFISRNFVRLKLISTLVKLLTKSFPKKFDVVDCFYIN